VIPPRRLDEHRRDARGVYEFEHLWLARSLTVATPAVARTSADNGASARCDSELIDALGERDHGEVRALEAEPG